MRTRLRSKVTLLLMLCAVLIAIPGAAALAQDTGTSPAPTIQSDKADYAPGELVTLTGSGWQPGESVRIFVNDDQGQTWNRIQDVTADASGNISDSFNLPNWFVAQYSATATGTQSGTATTSFTDADVVYNPPRFPTTGFQSVAAGNNFSFNLNATKQGGGADPVVTGFAVEAVGGGSPTCGPPPSGTASTFPTSWVSTTQTFPKTLNSTTATTFPFTVAPPSNASPGFYQGVIKFMTSAGGRGPGTAVCVQVTPSDTTAPTVTSINRANANPTNASSVGWNVTFSESVTGVNIGANSDFALAVSSGLSGASITGITGSGSTYTITANTGSGDGTLGLNLNDNDSIADGAGNKLGGTGTGTAGGGGTGNGSFAGQEYTIDRTAANVTLTDVNGAARAFPYLTNQNVASLGGSCEPGGSPVHVTHNGGPTSPPLVPCSPSGSWTVNLMPPVSTDGVHNFAASQFDAVGNPGSSGNKPVQIDKTAPNVQCGSADGNWHADNVSINCTATDGGSGLANPGDASFNLTTNVAANTEDGNASTDSRTVSDKAGNSATAGPISGNKVDRKAPVLTDNGPTPTNPNGANNWYTTAVTNKFTATDGGSGFAPNGDLTKSITNSSNTDEGSAVKIASGAVSDAVGNSAASIDSAAFKIDLSNPTNVTFVGGPAANGSYDFGDTPAKPTCTANDAVSGFASCDVTGYSTAVGTHTMTATAKDNAGRTATATRQYTVKAWTFKGFYQPVDMNGIVNTVKGGSTVPIKFELLKGTTELTDTANVVQPLKAQKISCTTLTGDPEDLIEMTVTAARASVTTPLAASSSTTGRRLRARALVTT